MPAPSVIALSIAVAATVLDLRTRHIPNLLTFGSAAAALLFQVASHGPSGLVTASGGWLIGMAAFVPPYALGGIGAGDVKLVAALGAWLGPLGALWLAAYTAIAGGVISVLVASVSGFLRQSLSNMWLLLMHWRVAGLTPLSGVTLQTSRGPRVAYGVAILCGTVGSIWFR